jgi:SAM-dependent methyltransferase
MVNFVKKLIPNSIFQIYRHYKKSEKDNAHKGNNVECTICKSKFKYFAPFGLIKRENARCYTCGSLERHRLLWKYFNEELKYFKVGPKGRILHFAPEKMFYNLFDGFKEVEYIPCDLFPEGYQFEGESIIQEVDITKIPFEDDYFDFIVCNHVLEHIPDDKLAMSELYRVMKKGGQGIFQVPIDYNSALTYEDFSITEPKEREKAFGQNDHVRIYGLDYKNRLESASFNVVVDDYITSFTPKQLKKYGFMPSELIYKCSK